MEDSLDELLGIIIALIVYAIIKMIQSKWPDPPPRPKRKDDDRQEELEDDDV